jgi:predicted HTH domain antitoxin
MTTVSFQLPENVERQLRRELGDLDAAAKEAALVELYRQGQLSHGKLAEGLGISRYETDVVLKRHNVTEDLLSREEFDQQVNGLRALLGQ